MMVLDKPGVQKSAIYCAKLNFGVYNAHENAQTNY